MACSGRDGAVPVIEPNIVTERVRHDADDPAIWLHPTDRSRSLILGTDKHEDGALFVFDLDGRVIGEKTVRGLKRPNNVDVEYGLRLGGAEVDIAVVTERYANRIRVYSLPDMKEIAARDGTGYILVSDQAADQFHVFPREGEPGKPHSHPLLKTVRVRAHLSDSWRNLAGSDLVMALDGVRAQ